MNPPLTPPVASLQVHPDQVHEALRTVLDTHNTPGVILTLTSGPDPVLHVQDDERHTSISVTTLARTLGCAHPARDADDLVTRVQTWIAHRPVTDRQAQDEGIAALDWTDPYETTVGWRVFVDRNGVMLPWTPSADTPPTTSRAIRSAATDRAAQLTGEVQVVGDVALWTTANVPMLSTALLVNPEKMLAATTASGVATRDMHVVIVPTRPVVCASADAIRRLAGETAEAQMTLPWGHVADLGWV